MGKKVPHCEGCEYFKYEYVLNMKKNSLGNKIRFCINESSMIYDEGEYKSYYQSILPSEFKTSPKWCPLRNKQYKEVKKTFLFYIIAHNK